MNAKADRDFGASSAPAARGPHSADAALQIVCAAPISVLLCDADGRVIHRNAPAHAAFGNGNHLSHLFRAVTVADAPLDWSATLRGALASHAVQQFDGAEVSLSDGRSQTMNLTFQPAKLEESGDFLVVVFAVDVTEAARLAHRLEIAESLAAVGRLAARVAHELNNPLDGSLRYLGLCTRLLGEGDVDTAQQYIGEARRGLMRMARIVTELLDFSRSNFAYREGGDVNAVVEEAVRAMSDALEQSKVVVAASFLHDEMPKADSGRLFQVCCNLIKNAADAMPNGGCLTITTTLIDGDVVIRFEDNGVGLPDPIEQIFEPFFTTKQPEEGTGLGLCICRDYIRRLGGDIIAEHAAEKGSIFTVRFPAPGDKEST